MRLYFNTFKEWLDFSNQFNGKLIQPLSNQLKRFKVLTPDDLLGININSFSMKYLDYLSKIISESDEMLRIPFWYYIGINMSYSFILRYANTINICLLYRHQVLSFQQWYPIVKNNPCCVCHPHIQLIEDEIIALRNINKISISLSGSTYNIRKIDIKFIINYINTLPYNLAPEIVRATPINMIKYKHLTTCTNYHLNKLINLGILVHRDYSELINTVNEYIDNIKKLIKLMNYLFKIVNYPHCKINYTDIILRT